jgi:hypothetical protein
VKRETFEEGQGVLREAEQIEKDKKGGSPAQEKRL